MGSVSSGRCGPVVSIPYRYSTNHNGRGQDKAEQQEFQSLIGILQTVEAVQDTVIFAEVSIPYRYSTNKAKQRVLSAQEISFNPL